MTALRPYIAAIFLLVAGAVSAAGQVTPDSPDEVIRIDTELIDVPLTVETRDGKPIAGLKAQNFVIFEDGKKQQIERFAATAAPMEVALLLDTSGSTRVELTLIRQAAANFIAGLRPGDRVAIAAFRTVESDGRRMSSVEVLTPMTDDRAAAAAALTAIGNSFGTPLYDGMLKLGQAVFTEPPTPEFRGRRALIALTDGVDSTSEQSFDDVKNALRQSGVTTYFINVDTRNFFEESLLGDCETATRFSADQIRRYYQLFDPKRLKERTTNFCDLGDFERLDVSKSLYGLAAAEMKELSSLSGGRVFNAADLQAARSAFKAVAEELGTRYGLSYYSSNERRPGTYRSIKVEGKGLPPGAVIRFRQGYTVSGK